MNRPAVGIVALVLVLAAPSAFAGVIKGVLRIPATVAPIAAPDPYPGQAGALPDVAPIVHGQVSDAVVYVESIPGQADSVLAKDAQPPQMAQKGQNFVPRVVAVPAGGVVVFPNFDPIFHNAFSISPIKRFDLGKYPRGQSRRVTFPKPGVVHVFCDIHANMAAYILVLPNRAFAQPDGFGEFELPNLPAGSYRVKVWHPDMPALERRVELQAKGVVHLNLGYDKSPSQGVADADSRGDGKP